MPKIIKNIGIKASGDVLNCKGFLSFVTEKAAKNYVVVVAGGGSDINKALREAGYEPAYDKHRRRITKTEQERAIMRRVLEKNTTKLQNKFIGTGVIVEPSFLDYAKVLCPINGDDFLTTIMYIGYDILYAVTTPERKEAKMEKFKDFPKIQVITV